MKFKKTDAEWKASLTPEQYQVMRKKATERPFSGKYDNFFEPGTYLCAACGAELFSSSNKFNAGCGWPSFSKPTAEKNVQEESDLSLPGMPRVEVMCENCGAHLGHVFPDGPKPTGLRYCINSVSLEFKSKGKK